MANAVRSDTVLDSFRDALDLTDRLVATAVEQGDLSRPTPCREWDLRALIDHMTFVLSLYGGMAAGEAPPDPQADHLGAEPVRAFREAGAHALDVFAQPTTLDQVYDSPWGKLPGYVLIQHVVNELLIHGWDVARATGQPTDFAPGLAAEARQVVEAWIELHPDMRTRQYDDPQTVPRGASKADELAAFTGRKVA